MATKRGIGSGIRKGGEVNLSLPKATRRKLEDEASVCARPRSRRIAAKAEQEPNHEDRIARMSWTVNDKEALLAALKAFGSRNIKELVRHTPDKNQQAITTFMNREKKNQNYVIEHLKKEDFDGSIVWATPSVKRRAKDSAIETWIQGTEHIMTSREKQKTDGDKVFDCSTTLPQMFDWISKYESHPPPELCGGIDYAAIYESLTSLMLGEVPKDLNEQTSQRMIDLISRLQCQLKTYKDALEPEVTFLDSYRDLKLRERVAPVTATNVDIASLDIAEEIAGVPSLNPLEFTPEMLAKTVLKKCSER